MGVPGDMNLELLDYIKDVHGLNWSETFPQTVPYVITDDLDKLEMQTNLMPPTLRMHTAGSAMPPELVSARYFN